MAPTPQQIQALLAMLQGTPDDDTNARADAIITDGQARATEEARPQQVAAQPAAQPAATAVHTPSQSFQRPTNVASPTEAFGEFMHGGSGGMPQMESANDPVESAALLDQRRGELQDRFDKGDFQGGKTERTLHTVNDDLASDPFTGAAAHAQTAANAATINKATLANQSPMIDQQHHNEQFELDKLLEPQKLKNAGDLAVRESENKGNLAVANARGDALRDVADTKTWGNGMKLTNDETNVMDKLHQTQMEGPQLLRMLEQADPGIATNTQNYKSWTDFFGAKVGGMLYRKGAPIDHSKIDQVTGFLGEIIPRMVVNSVRSKQLLDDLKLHAPQVGLSDGENYERLSYILHNIIPHTQQAIEQTHSAAPAYSPNDPSTWSRVQ